ncbi:MAG: DNA internalization-related competence protein ComEC/Rec2 [Chromatiales bacterium]|nr:MAG: DNA internalization-related competence protein ComEC/Rec2 [Chromatiales bacterium]
MALVPWLSLALLSVLLWWPGGWPGPLAPEFLALSVLGGSLLGGRRAFVLLLPLACTLLQAERQLADRLPESVAGQDFLLQGQVCDFPRRSGRALRFPVILDPRHSTPGLPDRVQLAWYDLADAPQPGERWQLLVRLRPPRTLASPGAFDGERAALVTATGARGYVRKSVLNRRLADTGWDCPTLLLRRWVAGRVAAATGAQRGAGYLLALTVGARHQLGTHDWDRLRRTGTAHLMAISGLHIGLLAGVALLVARGVGYSLVRFRCPLSPRPFALVAALLAACSYAALAGFALPTRRALLMLCVWSVLSLASRGVGAWGTLTAALWLVLVTDGLAVLTTGFWLSFGAVAVLLTATLASGRDETRSSLVQRLRSLGDAQWRVFVGLAPIAALSFGELPLVSPIANLVAVPLFGIAILPLAMLGVTLVALNGPAAPLRWAAELLGWLLEWLDWLDLGAWATPVLPFWYLPLAAIGTVALLWPRPLPARWLAVSLLPAVLLLEPRPPPPGQLRVQILDVGQGLAVILRTRSHTLVYDTGPAFGAGDAGRAVVLPALRRSGARRVDAIVVSHADLDHAGGVTSLHAAYPAAVVLAPDVASLDVPAVNCRRDQQWVWDGIEFRFLHPAPAFLRGSRNDRSCVLLVQGPRVSVLLPGDVSQRGEASLAPQLPATGIDLVVAPHHGSATSSSASFVTRSRPRYVVFTAGYRNRWGFPRPDVAARWRRTGACLLNTAHEGALLFDMRDGRLALRRRHRRASARAWTRPPGAAWCGAGDTTL